MERMLQGSEDRGYPTEYLVARIMGRENQFIKEWDDIIVSPEPAALLSRAPFGEFFASHSLDGAWKWALSEYGWVYRQMNAGLQKLFMPLFAYLELQTLIKCLRHKITQTQENAIKILLSHSLLSHWIKGVVMRESDVSGILNQFQKKIFHGFSQFSSLTDIYARKGLSGVEHELSSGVLENIVSLKLHPVLRKFFVHLINAKNIIASYKRLRWDMSAETSFIRGGTIRESVLRNVLRNGDLPGLHQLALRKANIVPQGERSDNLESILHTGLYRQVRIMARTGSAPGLLLHYLWGIYIQAHNLSMIQYGSGIDRDILRRELII